jgi:hypothetical protein
MMPFSTWKGGIGKENKALSFKNNFYCKFRETVQPILHANQW